MNIGTIWSTFCGNSFPTPSVTAPSRPIGTRPSGGGAVDSFERVGSNADPYGISRAPYWKCLESPQDPACSGDASKVLSETLAMDREQTKALVGEAQASTARMSALHQDAETLRDAMFEGRLRLLAQSYPELFEKHAEGLQTCQANGASNEAVWSAIAEIARAPDNTDRRLAQLVPLLESNMPVPARPE